MHVRQFSAITETDHFEQIHRGRSLVINFDNNASTPLTPSVTAAISATLCEIGSNPSSENLGARRLRSQIEIAREDIAAFIGALPEEIVFVSGATEANNTVISSVAGRNRDLNLLSTQVEHASVLGPLQAAGASGERVELLPVSRNGAIDLAALESSLRAGPALLSVQWVNNETGVVQPIPEIAALAERYGAILHIDAAQALGRTPINLDRIRADFMSFSGHKLHAPSGIGVLFSRSGKLAGPLLRGGDQERGRRAGTENCLGIIGLGAAIKERSEIFGEAVDHMNRIRARFEDAMLAELPDIEIIGSGTVRIGNTSNIRFPGVDGQLLAIRLNEAGLYCSQSSACHSKRPEPSHVLRAMGYSEDEAYSCIRFSFSVLNCLDEVETATGMIAQEVKRTAALARG